METQARTSPITGKEGAEIELQLAAEWTKNHRERHPHGSISQFFGIEILQRLLQQPGCLGIRIYYANSQKLNGWQKFILALANFLKKSVAGAVGEDHFILVGATAEGLDQLPADNQLTNEPGMIRELIFDYISSASGLLPVIAFAYNYRQLDRISKTIGVFFIIAALADLMQWLLPMWHMNNMPVISAFIIVNIIFFGIIYYKVLINVAMRWLTVVLSVIAGLISLYYSKDIFAEPWANAASSIAFIILALIYFYQLLNLQEFVHIEKQGLFWFNAAVLFYFSINIFVVMLIGSIPVPERAQYLIIQNITNIIANLLYSIALLCRPQKIT